MIPPESSESGAIRGQLLGYICYDLKLEHLLITKIMNRRFFQRAGSDGRHGIPDFFYFKFLLVKIYLYFISNSQNL